MGEVRMRVKCLYKNVIATSPTVLWLDDVAISAAHSVILRSPMFLPDNVRISSFKIFLKKNQKDEILTVSKNEASG
jgi:hypothetical protein